MLSCPPLPEVAPSWSRRALVAVVREEIERARRQVADGGAAPAAEEVAAAAAASLRRLAAPRPRRVVNATGVVVHTNLGRAPLGRTILDAIAEAAGYCDLEYDVASGERGSRHAHVEDLLRFLFPGHAALAVNNNAAALLLVLNTLAFGRGVVVSRGELVEIGGSFRVPEILERSGARLVEIGTTNRTHLRDYEAAAATEGTGLVLKVWPSNYRVIGFTADVGVPDLVRVARAREIPLAVDQGCGRLYRDAPGPASEQSVEELLDAGADVVCFSGDKMLGGPQCGVIVGRPEIVRRCAKNPLARALRPDKLTLAALAATLRAFLSADPGAVAPALRMLELTAAEIEPAARRLAERIRAAAPACAVDVREGASRVGGGAAPEEDLPTWLVAVRAPGLSEETLLGRLRAADPPVVARAQDGTVLFDPRTLLPGDEDPVVDALRAAFS